MEAAMHVARHQVAALVYCCYNARNVNLRTLLANTHFVDHRLSFHPSEYCRSVRLQVHHVL